MSKTKLIVGMLISSWGLAPCLWAQEVASCDGIFSCSNQALGELGNQVIKTVGTMTGGIVLAGSKALQEIGVFDPSSENAATVDMMATSMIRDIAIGKFLINNPKLLLSDEQNAQLTQRGRLDLESINLKSCHSRGCMIRQEAFHTRR